MALEGKCSTEQVNGQTSTPIENTTCTVMRRQTLRTLFFISKHHPYICKDSMTDFSNSDKNPQAMSLLAISSEGWQSKHRDKKNHTCRSSDVIQIAEKHPSLWAQQTQLLPTPLCNLQQSQSRAVPIQVSCQPTKAAERSPAHHAAIPGSLGHQPCSTFPSLRSIQYRAPT